jgi:hypothetical protein
LEKSEVGYNLSSWIPDLFLGATRLLRQSLKSTLRIGNINYDESERFPSGVTLIGKSGELLGHLTVSKETQGNQQPSLPRVASAMLVLGKKVQRLESD